MNRWLILILIAAALLRFGYQEAMLGFGGSFHNGSDSGKYLVIADTIFETGRFGRETGDGVQAEANRMPLYPYFVAGIFTLFGKGNLHAVVLVQILLDMAMIVGLALAALAIDRRLVVPAAALAAIMPNFLVHASYILTETLFLFLFVWGTCACLWAIRKRQQAWLLTGAGVCFGLSLLTRPVMMYFPLFLFVTLLSVLPGRGIRDLARKAMLASIPALLIVAFAAPRMVANYLEYGHAVLTTQSGTHLLKWVYPCLRTPWSCSSFGQAWRENDPILKQRIQALPEAERTNPVAVDIELRKLAMERIRELGATQIVLGMAVGAFKNLIQTGFYEVLAQFGQPATFLSAMPGQTTSERLLNFVKTNATNVFMILWVVSQAALVLSRLVQLAGLGSGLVNRATRPYALFLAMTIVYFLAINGPIANPKYRIPMEPALIIFFSIGLCALLDWYRARRQRHPVAAAAAEAS